MAFHRRLASQHVPSNSTLAAAPLFSLILLSASLAHADVIFNVNTVADQIDLDVSDGICQTSTGACSLRAAIMQANHLTGPIATRIKLPVGNYVLTRPVAGADGEDSGDLNLTSPLSAGQSIEIEGATASTSIIDANQIDRVLSIDLNRVVTLSKITLRGGYSLSALTRGGGIYSLGALTVLDSIIEANAANNGNGGGVHSLGTLHVERSIIRSNSGFLGGAVYLRGTGIIRESSIFSNAASFGGAIAKAIPSYITPQSLAMMPITIATSSGVLAGA